MTVQQQLQKLTNEQTELRTVVTERFKIVNEKLKEQSEATSGIQAGMQTLSLSVGKLIQKFDDKLIPGEASKCALHEEKLNHLAISLEDVKKKSDNNSKEIGKIDKRVGIIIAIPSIVGFGFVLTKAIVYFHDKAG